LSELTGPQLERARALWDSQASVREIRDDLNIKQSRSTLGVALIKLFGARGGRAGRKAPTWVEEEFKALWIANVPRQDILLSFRAKDYLRSKSSSGLFRRWARRLGLPEVRPCDDERVAWTEEEDKILRHSVASRQRMSTIATALGRTKGAVQGRMASLGLGYENGTLRTATAAAVRLEVLRIFRERGPTALFRMRDMVRSAIGADAVAVQNAISTLKRAGEVVSDDIAIQQSGGREGRRGVWRLRTDAEKAEGIASPPASRRKNYTPSEDAEIARLLDKEASLADISAAFNVSVQAIRWRIKKLREKGAIPSPDTWPEGRIELLRQRALDGASIRTMGREFCVTPRSITRALKKYAPDLVGARGSRGRRPRHRALFAMLKALEESDRPLTWMELRAHAGLASDTNRMRLKRLVAAGFVTRAATPSETSAKWMRYAITDAGREALRANKIPPLPDP
jgi:predicted ArsR family transcriptional regulator